MVQHDPRTYEGGEYRAQRQPQQGRARRPSPSPQQRARQQGRSASSGARGQQDRPARRSLQQNDARHHSRNSYTNGKARQQTGRSGERPTYAEQMYQNPGRYSKSQHSSKAPKRHSSFLKKALIALAAALVIFAVLIVVKPFGLFGGEDASSTGQQKTVASTTATAKTVSLPTPIMAQSEGLDLHSAVAMESLTEVLIHNASYEYACDITTKLTEATNTEIIAAHGTGRVASEQPTGNQWMTGEFIRCFRSENAGSKMSAIDCGGPVGATVYAPVSGKVVLVKEYELYQQFDDIQIHIQPEGRSDLDVVLIHLTDPSVKAGDIVEAGKTPIAKIRDVYQYIGESMQLKQYTASSDNGNHTHIQVNDATDPEYHGLDDLKPKTSSSASAGSAEN